MTRDDIFHFIRWLLNVGEVVLSEAHYLELAEMVENEIELGRDRLVGGGE
jgi:hypothetical protein